MNLTYTKDGDYLVPNVIIHLPPYQPLSGPLWAPAEVSFLEQYNPIYYNELVLTERLFDHCLEIEDAATSAGPDQGRRCNGRTEGH